MSSVAPCVEIRLGIALPSTFIAAYSPISCCLSQSRANDSPLLFRFVLHLNMWHCLSVIIGSLTLSPAIVLSYSLSFTSPRAYASLELPSRHFWLFYCWPSPRWFHYILILQIIGSLALLLILVPLLFHYFLYVHLLQVMLFPCSTSYLLPGPSLLSLPISMLTLIFLLLTTFLYHSSLLLISLTRHCIALLPLFFIMHD